MIRGTRLKVMPVKRIMLVGCIALMAISVVMTTHKITSLSDRLTNSQSKLVWYMLSLSNEYDALITLLQRFQSGETSFDHVAIQHEILWSRFPIAIAMAKEEGNTRTNPSLLLEDLFTDHQSHEASFYTLRFSTHNIDELITHYQQQRERLGHYFNQALSLPGNGYLDQTKLLNQLGQLTTLMTFGMIAVGGTVLLLVAHDAKRYYKLAREDQLTGLNNRHWLFETLNHRYGLTTQGLSILVIDLDGFKAINDNYGHDVGDMFLKSLAKRFVAELPSNAALARLGGDEFAAIVPFENKTLPEKTAKLLVDIAHRQSLLLGYRCQASASIGVAFGCGEINGQTLLSYADTAMYMAKREGKNQYCIYDTTMHSAPGKQHTRVKPRPEVRGNDAGNRFSIKGGPVRCSPNKNGLPSTDSLK
ncbi:sensor domain-containing diguanylate cyclase [Salinivibrio socompensis]|uniref:GGDEF domain-containing protein n=1 Tax=Salinivibrio socompensis TaxID=1510206 RepID=UPI000FE141EC|nr:GGDEF domain-containing protein [Salinivibrio socompensis]